MRLTCVDTLGRIHDGRTSRTTHRRIDIYYIFMKEQGTPHVTYLYINILTNGKMWIKVSSFKYNYA